MYAVYLTLVGGGGMSLMSLYDLLKGCVLLVWVKAHPHHTSHYAHSTPFGQRSWTETFLMDICFFGAPHLHASLPIDGGEKGNNNQRASRARASSSLSSQSALGLTQPGLAHAAPQPPRPAPALTSSFSRQSFHFDPL